MFVAACTDTSQGYPSAEQVLALEVIEKFGGECRVERTCGQLLGVDCESALDGPYYFVEKSDLKVISICGGYCMGRECTGCPPREWTCPLD
jgi:hypothetical protein